jgi:hypothetical protein
MSGTIEDYTEELAIMLCEVDERAGGLAWFQVGETCREAYRERARVKLNG